VVKLLDHQSQKIGRITNYVSNASWKNFQKKWCAMKNFSRVKNDVWETPDTVFLDACTWAEIEPKLDVCTNGNNSKCDFYFTEEDNGLEQNWFADSWMNCPYSNASKWIRKAWYENKKNNINVLALLNVTSDTVAWHDCILETNSSTKQNVEIYFIKGRLRFIKDGHLSHQPSQHPSCYVLWRKRI